MRQGLPIPDWNYVGALLADSDEEQQIKFFKSFVKECKSWGTSFQVGMQLAGICRKLTKEEIEVLSQITYEK